MAYVFRRPSRVAYVKARSKQKPFLQSVVVTTTLAPATATGAAGSFTPSPNILLVGAVGVGVAEAPTQNVSVALAAATAAGVAEAPSIQASSNISLPAAAATGIAEPPTTSASALLPSVAAVAVAEAPTPQAAAALAVAFATGVAGNLAETIALALAAATGTGAAGALAPSVSVNALSVAATGAVGTLGLQISSNVTLAAATCVGAVGALYGGQIIAVATATAEAGEFGPQIGLTIAGAVGIGSAASFGFAFSISAVGVAAVSSVGQLLAEIFAQPSTPVALLLAAAIAGNAPVLGCYTVPESDIFDLGYEAVIAIGLTWLATGEAAGANILDITDWLAQQDLLGSAAAAGMISWAEINIGSNYDGPPLSSLSSADRQRAINSATWSGWQKYVPGTYAGRLVNWRFWVEAPSPQVQGSLVAATGVASIEDRVDHYQNFSCSSSGTTIVFQPDGAATPAPFNAGLNGSALPTLYPPVWAQQPGDTYQYTGLSLSQVTLAFYNGGSPVTRTVQAMTVAGF